MNKQEAIKAAMATAEKERRKAPWKDAEENELFEGDKIRYRHRLSGIGRITFIPTAKTKWKVEFPAICRYEKLENVLKNSNGAVKVPK